MKQATLDVICCPDCKGRLILKDGQITNEEITAGFLECSSCKKTYPIINGVPRMILSLDDREKLSRSWGYQWAKMAEGMLETDTYYGDTEEQEIADFFKYFKVAPEDLKGKKILDAGCGFGRLTRALGKYGAQVFGIDIASSIERIYAYCSMEPGVDIIQADISAPPFPDKTFDYISCKLALCYLPDPGKAFKTLAGMVKPAGRFFVSLPDKSDPAFTVRLKNMLKITHRIPIWILIYISWGLAPVLWLGRKFTKKPGNSLRTNAFLIFNAWHSRFSLHTEKEVINWFNAEKFGGIEAIHGMPHSVNVLGIKQ